MRYLALLALSLEACATAPDWQRLADSYNALAERVDEHARATASSGDPGEIAAETRSYCAEMDGLTAEMEEACDDMMGDGMMGGGTMSTESRERVIAALGEMDAELGRHCEAMDDQDDAGSMHDECDAHDEAMEGPLADLRREVPEDDGSGSCGCC